VLSSLFLFVSVLCVTLFSSPPLIFSSLSPSLPLSTAADGASDFATAIVKYDSAVESFTKAKGVEPNQLSRKLLNDQMVTCMQRSETLKSLSATGSVAGMIPRGMAPAQDGKKQKYEAPKVRIDKKMKKTWKKN
jgi:MIT (microtubule interacting and transport) domain